MRNISISIVFSIIFILNLASAFSLEGINPPPKPFIIENNNGYIRAAVPADLYFTTDEEKLYRDYNLEADELELEAINERLKLQARIKNMNSN